MSRTPRLCPDRFGFTAESAEDAEDAEIPTWSAYLGELGELRVLGVGSGLPEAESAYFYAECGKRTGLFVFDLKDSAQIPAIAEPWFMLLNAEVDFRPVMNLDDLKKGVEAAMKAL